MPARRLSNRSCSRRQQRGLQIPALQAVKARPSHRSCAPRKKRKPSCKRLFGTLSGPTTLSSTSSGFKMSSALPWTKSLGWVRGAVGKNYVKGAPVAACIPTKLLTHPTHSPCAGPEDPPVLLLFLAARRGLGNDEGIPGARARLDHRRVRGASADGVLRVILHTYYVMDTAIFIHSSP